MKKVIIGIAIIIGIAGLSSLAVSLMKINTKKHSPESVVSYDKNNLKLTVAYCQPSKKGREIFGKLVPYDNVWRTGANEATIFTTNKDLRFGDQVLKAGTYSLFSIPQAEEWTVIFNEETGQWGTAYSESDDVLRVPAVSSKIDKVRESFTISFEENGAKVNMLLNWDDVLVKVPIMAAN